MGGALTRRFTDDGDPTLVIDTWIPGEPRPLGRPRMNRQTGNVFTPKDSRDELERIAWLLRGSRPNRAPKGTRVSVDLVFCRTTNTKVDIDNLMKMILDAAKEILWHDDDQVFVVTARKYVGVGAERAGTRITVRTIQP